MWVIAMTKMKRCNCSRPSYETKGSWPWVTELISITPNYSIKHHVVNRNGNENANHIQEEIEGWAIRIV